MFSEILRIKPVLDESSAKQMETSLHARFARVASRFGSGLKSVVKGSILGISLGLLNKILNPIEQLDEKIKGLLGHGTDTKDLAQRLGSSSGEVNQLQNVAASFGVAPDKFNETILQFAQGIEKAREELANKFVEPSASTLALAPFAKETNIVKGFKDFMFSQQKIAAGPGKDQPLTAHASTLFAQANADKTQLSEEDRQKLIASGEIRRLTGPQAVHGIEQNVFGAQQFGGMRKLLDSNIDEQAKLLRQPSVATLTENNDKMAQLQAQKNVLDVQNKTKDFIDAAQKINENMITAMASAEARQESETSERLGSYTSLKDGAKAVANIETAFHKLLDLVSVGLGKLEKITEVIPQFTKSPLVKGIFKTFSKGE